MIVRQAMKDEAVGDWRVKLKPMSSKQRLVPPAVGAMSIVICTLGACSSPSTAPPHGSSTGEPPEPTVDAGPDVEELFEGGILQDAAPSTKFFVLVTQTPAGSPPVAEWGGIYRYDVADTNVPAVMGQAIDKADVHDPLGLAFRKKSAELFVGNRHGNNAGDGVAGSISRFDYLAATETFVAKPQFEITGNGMGAISQIAFNPKEDELFAANCCNGGNGISRFLIDDQGLATPNGSIPNTTLINGLAVAPDGKRLYAVHGGGLPASYIRQFELPSGNELAIVPIPGASGLHHMTIYGQDLFIGDVYAPGVFRYKIDANDDVQFVELIGASAPISAALSPDGRELFATGHKFGTTSIIDRFLYSGMSWMKTMDIMTPASNGGTVVFEASSLPILK